MSLDVFRGATIAAMMLVNNPGSWDHIYEQLDHAEWNGWTFTDVIFPFFIWIVGVAIPLSAVKRRERGESPLRLLAHAFRRSAILFSLGLSLALMTMALNGSYGTAGGFPGWLQSVWTTIRIPGVLQRIAICYFAASAVYLFLSLRGQIAVLLSLLAGYWMLMKYVPVPGHGAGILTPEGNFSAYIDSCVLGKHTLAGKAWDPEGILSTLPAIATCLMGIFAGNLLLMKQSPEQKSACILVSGNLLMLAGAVMNIWLPINKNLWTSTYAVFMAGLAMAVFGCLHWLVDVKAYQKWAKPFAIFGMNAIAVFMASGILGRLWLFGKVTVAEGKPIPVQKWLYTKFFENNLSGLNLDARNISLTWAVCYMLMLYLLAYGLYRKKWFIRF
jgi:predicted acyltransferase